VFTPVPQRLKNIYYASGADPLASLQVQATIAAASRALKGTGRVLVRKSGTEPLIRIMAEGEDRRLLDHTIATIATAILAAGVA
jgi:phosphoglucosamine mutase